MAGESDCEIELVRDARGRWHCPACGWRDGPLVVQVNLDSTVEFIPINQGAMQ